VTPRGKRAILRLGVVLYLAGLFLALLSLATWLLDFWHFPRTESHIYRTVAISSGLSIPVCLVGGLWLMSRADKRET